MAPIVGARRSAQLRRGSGRRCASAQPNRKVDRPYGSRWQGGKTRVATRATQIDLATQIESMQETGTLQFYLYTREGDELAQLSRFLLIKAVLLLNRVNSIPISCEYANAGVARGVYRQMGSR